jgi:hypothetical protein
MDRRKEWKSQGVAEKQRDEMRDRANDRANSVQMNAR